MGKSSPSPPSPAAQAAAQTKTNKETAYWNAVLNNVDQYTPYGNITYEQTGGGKTYNEDAYNKAMDAYNISLDRYRNSSKKSRNNIRPPTAPDRKEFLISDAPPSFTSTIELSPEQQQILDSQNRQNIAMSGLGEQQIDRIGQAVESPYSYDNIQNALPTYGNINEASLRAEEALMSRFNPQFERDEEAMRTRLINQGIGQGSQAYAREMETFNQAKNDARMQAILGGQQFGSNEQNMALQRRGQEIGEYNSIRNAPLNEYIGLTSGTQITNPTFSSGGYQGIQPFDMAGAMRNDYSNRMASANNQNSAMGSLFGMGANALGGFLGSSATAMPALSAGATGLASAGSLLPAALFSDVRLKENLEKVGEKNGFNLYKFNYIGKPEKTYIGVIAQEVEKINPEAVTEIDGYKAVSYEMLGLEMVEVETDNG